VLTDDLSNEQDFSTTFAALMPHGSSIWATVSHASPKATGLREQSVMTRVLTGTRSLWDSCQYGRPAMLRTPHTSNSNVEHDSGRAANSLPADPMLPVVTDNRSAPCPVMQSFVIHRAGKATRRSNPLSATRHLLFDNSGRQLNFSTAAFGPPDRRPRQSSRHRSNAGRYRCAVWYDQSG